MYIIELLFRKKLLQALSGKLLLCRGPWVIGTLVCIQCDPGGTVLPATVRNAICAVQDGGHIDSAYTCIDSLSAWGCYALGCSIGIQQLQQGIVGRGAMLGLDKADICIFKTIIVILQSARQNPADTGSLSLLQ